MAEIIIPKKGKKAPFEFSGHPYFGDSSTQTLFQKQSERKYWEDQRELWIKGYNGLTGLHYFYLTMGGIKTVSGEIIQPYWRDMDHEIFKQYEYCNLKKLTLAVVKRREFGLTSIFAGCVPIYNALVNTGSVTLLTSADKDRVKAMFAEKTSVFFNNLPLPDRFKPKKLSERQDGILTLSSGTGGFGEGSKVKCLETADNDKNAKRFEAERAIYIFLDEWFLHPRADIVLNSSRACMTEGFSLRGSMVIGGSCGGANDNDLEKMKHSSALVEQMVSDSEINGLNVLFISGTKCISRADDLGEDGKPNGKTVSFMKNGYSEDDKAMEWIKKRRKFLEKGKDKKPLYNFIRSFPLSLEEVFDINKQGILSEEVYASLSLAKQESIKGDCEKRISLRRDSKSKRIEVINSSKSIYTIVEEPNSNKTYISGTDPIPLGGNISDEGSEYAQIIYCIEDEMAVAYYSRRDMDADRLIGDNILLQEWYKSIEFPNGAPTMVEYNRGEVAMRIYNELGRGDLLADRPKNLGITYEESIKGKKGWYSNDKTIARANSYLIKNLIEFADRQRLLRLINEASIFPNGNLDVLDAYKSAMIYLTDYKNAMKKIARTGVTTIDIPYIGIDKNGKRVRMWYKRTVDQTRE